MNKQLYTLFFFLFTCASFAQQDTGTVLADIRNAQNLIQSNVPSALDRANTALINAQNSNFDQGIAEAYIVAGRCYIQTGDIEAQKALKTALKYAEKTTDKALISDCYFYLGQSCYINGDTKSELEWYNKAFDLRKELGDEKRIADSYHAYGNVYLDRKKDSIAGTYFLLAKPIREKLNDIAGLASVYNNLALIADHKGDSLTYLKLMYESLAMNEEIGNQRNIATNHGNLGTFFYRHHTYDSSWYHNYKCYEIRKNNDFKDHLAGSYTDLGDVLFAEKKYGEALEYYKKGAELAESIKGTEWILKNYKALADAYKIMDSTEAHLKYQNLYDKINKEQASNMAATKLMLPAAFDYAEPKPKPNRYWFTGSTAAIIAIAIAVYRRKKRNKNKLK